MINVRVTGFHAGFFAACFSLPLCLPAPALAQSEITVYAPFRGIATPIARAGSSVSVITREEIDQAGQLSVAELLRTVPGVSFTDAGGFGSNSDMRIRGAESQHTMVLIDGVPVSNTTSTRNTFDFSSIAPDMIEQIEVLRGPQSALYGSDAIGGVINIITRQAAPGFSGSVSVEGGSYGTHRESAQIAYGSDTVGLFGSVSHTSSEGFSRRSSNSEEDGAQQWSGFVRGSAQLSETLRVDAQIQANDTELELDESTTDTSGARDLRTINGSVRVQHESFDARWINTLTLYGGLTDNLDDRGTKTDRFYEGGRQGGEITSQFSFGGYGTLLGGVSIERQDAAQGDVGSAATYDASETYLAAFAMHQFSLGPNLHLSAALRVDDFDAAGTFVTGRGTAVYEIHETETRFHASVGTGADAPTLYQRFGPSLPNPDLLPEESIGFDAGITQVLFDGRLSVDVTAFYNQIENMIDYDFALGYLNRSEAETYGVEVTADARLIPGQLDASAHYTYLVANDVSTGLRLARRPEHEAQLTLTYTGIDRLSLSGTVSGVGGDWFNNDSNTTRLDPYVRVDVSASYQAHDHLEIFGRVENLFDADYQVRTGYNTPGLSAYAGIRATF